MKAIFRLILSAAAILSVSCAKGQEPVPVPPSPSDDSLYVKISAPEMSDGTVRPWAEGDIVAVFSNAADATLYRLRAISSGSTAVFKGDPALVGRLGKSYRMFYPYNTLLRSTSGTNVSFSFPQIQKGEKDAVAQNVIPMTFHTTDTALGSDITMRSLAGLLKFSIAGGDIVSVTLTLGTSVDTDYLSGDKMEANCSTLNTHNKNSTIKSNSLTMTPPSGQTFTPGQYCFAIITKSSTRSFTGWKLIYKKSDGSSITRSFPDALIFTSQGTVTIPGDETRESGKCVISGKVTDAVSSVPIAGVPVSDGVQIVKTDAQGAYSFTTDTKKSQSVFVIMPAEYEISGNEYGGWADWRPVDADKAKQTVDFSLTKRKNDSDKYRILMLGDPQRMSSRAHSIESWTYVCNAINAYRTSVSVPLYQISLGDMVTNEIEVPGMAEKYLATQKTSGVITFSTPGNHDHIQAATTYFASVSGFSKWFGPYNYSFNLGRHHFISLDSCAWCEGTGSDKYAGGLNAEAVNFLERDLALVDKSVPVHIFTHVPLTRYSAPGYPSKLNKDRMFKALAGRTVHFWYGHMHYGSNHGYSSAEISSHAPGLKALESHVVARCGGCWSCSGEICKDGAPRGFTELDLDGTDAQWHFHSINTKYPDTFNVYLPGQFAGEGLEKVSDTALYCDIYLWDDKWGMPEIWINGVKKGVMEQCLLSEHASYDPLFQHFYKIWKAEGKMEDHDDTPTTKDNAHLFKYEPDKSVKSVEIRFTDRWGGKFSRTVSW